jgi:hypothetical protein
MLLKDGVERGKKRINIPNSYKQTDEKLKPFLYVEWHLQSTARSNYASQKGEILNREYTAYSTCTQQRAFSAVEYSHYHAISYDDCCSTSHR